MSAAQLGPNRWRNAGTHESAALRSIVLLAAARNADAFEELVRRYRPMALGYAWSRLGDRQTAEDAVQNAFIAAWGSLDQIRDPDRFPGWLRRVVHSHCERLRRVSRVPTVELDDIAHVSAPTPDAAVRGRTARLEQAVAALPDGLRNVVTLFYYGERSMREVRTIPGLTRIDGQAPPLRGPPETQGNAGPRR